MPFHCCNSMRNICNKDPQTLLAAGLESFPAAVWITDTDGRLQQVSQSCADLVGRPVAQCLGRKLEDILPASLASTYAARQQQLLASPARKRYEQIWPTPDGEPRWFEIHMSSLRDAQGGAIIGVSGYAQDITQRIEQQETARRVQAELEKRVDQRTRQLSLINEELEAFSYSVSHDLRAPLRQITGFAELMENRQARDPADACAKYLPYILDNTRRMDRLVNDLLQLARIDQHHPPRTEVDLAVLAREAIDDLRANEPQRDVAVALPGAAPACCDAGLIRIALVNLLGNAWKFTSRTPQARIEFGSFARGAGMVYFVRDNGAGFDMRHAGRLFGAFQRFHRASDFPGTGIGLATVRRIVNRHGGQIWAESAPGQGATFYFTLELLD